MGYMDLVAGLTARQRAELAERGVTRQRVTDWKHGRRLPTRPQAAHLADVTGYSFLKLERELTELEAKEEDRPRMAEILGKAVAAGAAAITCGFGGLVALCVAKAETALMYTRAMGTPALR